MKDYVFRIYGRDKNDPQRLVGVVEEVGIEGSKAFSNLDELLSILNSSKAETRKSNKLNELNKPNEPNKLK